MFLKKLLGIVSAVTMVAIGLVALPIQQQAAEAAPPGSAFDPGLIISDSVFYDFGSMTVDQIQSFLDSRVTNCRATDPSIDCLKNIRVDIPETPATGPNDVGPCSAISAKAQATAAEVIHAIANSCGINPKVLIVTLQKEQGLVSSTRPTPYMYRAAMGFGCPDSDPGICGKVFVGLFNQLYRGARQLQWYGDPAGSFTYWKPGRTVAMRFHPRSSCGTKSFLLQNQATANLYYYTPYTPNDAALGNLYGTGDSCSAYGNRNFWRFYHDWFGSPIGGGYLLKAAGTETFLIVNDQKYLVNDARLLAALRPLGPIGEISQAYLDSFVTAGQMSQVAKDVTSGQTFLLVDGVRFAADCPTLTQYGADCNLAVPLVSLQLNAFQDGGTLSRLVVTESGARYWIENGTTRVVVDDLALNAAGGQGLTASKMTIEQVLSLSAGAPLASDLMSFKVSGLDTPVVLSGGAAYRVERGLAAGVNLNQWFPDSGAVVERSDIEAILSTQSITTFVRDANNVVFAITPSGKARVPNPEAWTTVVTALPAAILDRIPTITQELTDQIVLTVPQDRAFYFAQSGEVRSSNFGAMRNEFLQLLGQPAALQVPRTVLSSLVKAGDALAPGTVVKVRNSSTLFLVDDLGNRIRLASSDHAKSVTDSRVYTIGKTNLDALRSRPALTTIKVECNSQVFVLDNGSLYSVTAEVAAHFPGGAYRLSLNTCRALNLASAPIGQFIQDSAKNYFFVQNGKRIRLSGQAQYEQLKGTAPVAVVVTKHFLSQIPTGTANLADISLASWSGSSAISFGPAVFARTSDARPPAQSVVEPAPVVSPTPTPKPTATPIPTPRPTATPTPTPTLTPTPSPTPTPTPTPVGEQSYRVQLGDTLLRIAARFGVTVSALQSHNNISNPNSIRIGQLLKIPTDASGSSVVEAAPAAPAEPTSVSYRVKAGDTLWSIARQFGVSSSSIVELNKITNLNLIRVGQLLQIKK